MDLLRILLSFLLAYLLGSIPFGLLIGLKFCKKDVRQFGSGNIGATNCFRVLGKKWGGLVFFLDAVKGILGILMAQAISGHSQYELFPLFYGIAAIMGHTLPIWLKFKGGKGVATSLGVFLYLLPIPALITFILWLLIFFTSRIISLSSVIAALSFPISVFLTERSKSSFPVILLVALSLSAFILFTHRQNLVRLMKGEEKKII